jgi:hypothetical protein
VRPIGFVLGIGMHLMVALIMKNLIYFSFPPGQWRRVAGWFQPTPIQQRQ